MPASNSVEVYGTTSAAALAAALASEGMFFSCDPMPGDFYLFAVRDEAAAIRKLHAYTPRGTGWEVRLEWTDNAVLRESTHRVAAVNEDHAVILAVAELYREEGNLHLIDDEVQFTSKAVPVE